MTAPRERPVEWAALTTTHGEVLDAFASYCRDELEDVDVLAQTPTRLDLAWRRERSSVELADAPPAGREEPTLLVTALTDELVSTLLDDASLRARVAVYDLARLEKVNAVRSSVFVHFEWFLRDAYGVKLVASDAFTRGLVDRGIISLGFG
ncbi:MAG TPA: hypothetical protein VFA44_04690 [Gaiellaceae bacterium]|nr:hypothetical protein [Gaiellaceae bacterium]